MKSGFLRLYLRRTLRGRRLAAALAVFVVPVAMVIATLAGIRAASDSPQQRLDRKTQGSAVLVDLAVSSSKLSALSEPIVHLRDLWGPSYRVEPWIVVPSITASGPGGALTAYLSETPADNVKRLSLFRLASGEFATNPGQVAVSQAVAQRLGLETGSQLVLNLDRTAPMTVSGIFVPTTAHHGLQVITGPGSLATLAASQSSANLLIFSGSALIDRLDGGQVDPELRENSRAYGRVHTADGAVELRPFWIRNASLAAVPVLLLLGTIMVACSAIQSRRSRNELTFLWMLGLSTAQLRRLIMVEAVVVGVGGVMLAAISGLAAAVGARYIVADIAGRDIQPTFVGIDELLVVLAVPLLMSAGAGWIRLRWAKRDIQQSRNSVLQDFEAVPNSAVKKWRGRTLVAISLATVCAVLVADGPLQAMLAVTGLTVMMALVASVVLRSLWNIIRSRVRSGWLPAGLERGSAARSAAILIVTLTAVSIPCGLLATNNTYTAAAREQYRPEFPYGQVNIQLRGRQMPPTALEAITKAAGERPLVISRVFDPAIPPAGRWSAVPGDKTGPGEVEILVADDPLRATAPWGLPDDPALANWLTSGGALLLNSGRPEEIVEFEVTQSIGDAAATILGLVEARVVSAGHPLRRGASVVISAETAKGMGLPITTLAWRFPSGAPRIDAIRTAATVNGIAPDLIQSDPGPRDTVPISYDVALSASIGLVLISTFLISHVGLSELARTRRQLLRLGAQQRTVRAALYQLSVLASIVGAICGTGIGLFGAWISTLNRSIPFSVDLMPVLALTGAAVVAALLGSLKTAIAKETT